MGCGCAKRREALRKAWPEARRDAWINRAIIAVWLAVALALAAILVAAALS
jgi:hypothetical protein